MAGLGLAQRRECWCLTWKGRLVAFVLVAAAIVFLVLEAHPFLTVTERVPADLMVVEGWAPAYSTRQAAEEFRSGHYKRVVLVRPVIDLDDKEESGLGAGEYLARMLSKHGVPASQIVRLYPVVAKKDRTFHSALAVRKWMEEQGMRDTSLDLITMGPHARRSRLLYEKAFAGRMKIGVVAMTSYEYDQVNWWRTSEGIEDALCQSAAYLYARLWFNSREAGTGAPISGVTNR